VTLNDLEDHSWVAGLIKCNPLNILYCILPHFNWQCARAVPQRQLGFSSKFFTRRLKTSKFITKLSLMIQSHLKCVLTLPCTIFGNFLDSQRPMLGFFVVRYLLSIYLQYLQMKWSQLLLPFVFRLGVSSPDFLFSSSHNWLPTHTHTHAHTETKKKQRKTSKLHEMVLIN